jgi:hypothetical protein
MFSLNKWLIACVLVLIFLQLYDTILNFCFFIYFRSSWFMLSPKKWVCWSFSSSNISRRSNAQSNQQNMFQSHRRNEQILQKTETKRTKNERTLHTNDTKNTRCTNWIHDTNAGCCATLWKRKFMYTFQFFSS